MLGSSGCSAMIIPQQVPPLEAPGTASAQSDCHRFALLLQACQVQAISHRASWHQTPHQSHEPCESVHSMHMA